MPKPLNQTYRVSPAKELTAVAAAAALALAAATAAFVPTPVRAAAAPAAASEQASPASAQPLPSHIDLTPKFEKWELDRRRQGSRGTCSVFVMTGALEFANAASHDRGERLSVEYLNWAANQLRRQPRDGGFFSDMWRGLYQHGICLEAQMPYRDAFDPSAGPSAGAIDDARSRPGSGFELRWIKRWDVRTGLTDEQFAQIKRTLNSGWPVCGGLRWPKRERWKEHVLEMCVPEAVFDGHSVLLVGYRDDDAQPGGGTFLFRNSNGGRDGAMPYAYAAAYMNDAAWITAKPAAATSDAPSKPSGATDGR